jgi:hypothetical protein
MVHKLAIHVCPVPGCPTVGKTPTAGCPNPNHNRALVKEVYVHQSKARETPDLSGLADMFGKQRG